VEPDLLDVFGGIRQVLRVVQQEAGETFLSWVDFSVLIRGSGSDEQDIYSGLIVVIDKLLDDLPCLGRCDQ
jgi:hypothetical protein